MPTRAPSIQMLIHLAHQKGCDLLWETPGRFALQTQEVGTFFELKFAHKNKVADPKNCWLAPAEARRMVWGALDAISNWKP